MDAFGTKYSEPAHRTVTTNGCGQDKVDKCGVEKQVKIPTIKIKWWKIQKMIILITIISTVQCQISGEEILIPLNTHFTSHAVLRDIFLAVIMTFS